MSNSLWSHGLQSSRLLCPWDFPGKNTGVGCHGLLQGNPPNPGNKLRSPAFQADSLPAEPPGKPMNTAVGTLSLLQGNLPDPGIKLGSSAMQMDSLPAELSGKPFWACWSRNNQPHGFSQALGAVRMLRLLQFLPRASRRRSLYLLRLSHHRVLLSQAAVWLLFHLSLSYRDTATRPPKRIFNIWAFSYYCVLQGLQTGASHFAHHFLVVLFLFL